MGQNRDLYLDFWGRVATYLLLILGWFAFTWARSPDGFYLPIPWETLVARGLVTAGFVSASLLLIVALASLSAFSHIVLEHWRDERPPGAFIRSVAAFCALPRPVVAVLGTVPIFITAKISHVLAEAFLPPWIPLWLMALVPMVIGNFIFLQVHMHLYKVLSNEVESRYFLGSLARGARPKTALLRKWALACLEVSRSSIVELIGYSLFVERIFRGLGSAFKGLAWELWSRLGNEYGEDLFGAFQVLLAVLLLILLMDSLWTYFMGRLDRENADSMKGKL